MGRSTFAVVVSIVVATTGCTALFGLKPVGSSDRDNDGIEDSDDNCPDVFNPDQSDFDHNDKGDACDLCTNGGSDDVDRDGIPDGCDGCIGIGVDVDRDGIDDACDKCIELGVDTDQDGIDDGCDPCVGSANRDSDGDGIDDACDQCFDLGIDLDHDGIDDGCDPCVTTDPADLDHDGIADACDRCITTDHTDKDGDGIEDACDPCVCMQACPASHVPTNHDEDRDEIDDGCDNCPLVPNMNQNDGDLDGVGDKCDPSNKPHHGVFFDAFTSSVDTWYQLGSGWVLGVDQMLFVGGGGQSHRFVGPYGDRVIVSSVIVVPTGAMANSGDNVVIEISDAEIGAAQNAVRCGYLVNGAASAQFTYVATHDGVTDPRITGTTPLPLDQPFVLAITITDNGPVTCTIATVGNVTETIGGTTVSSAAWYAGMSGGGVPGHPYAFHAFDVVTQP